MRFARVMVMIVILLTAACNLTLGSPVTPTAPPTLPPIIITSPPPPSDPNATQPPQINPECPATPFNWIPYIVEPGDSLSLLAEQTSSTVNDLMAGNCLASADEIFVGQTLYLPTVPVVAPIG
jgi:hypothetical protein